MGTAALALVRNDPLILEACEASFRGSPEFVNYLVRRIVSLDGSYEFARVLCTTLRAQHTSSRPFVSAECVHRLSVDTIPGAVGKILASHSATELEKIVGNAVAFLMRVRGVIESSTRSEVVDDLIIRPRTSIYQLKTEAYGKLFYCAQAMLAGSKVNPRDMAA